MGPTNAALGGVTLRDRVAVEVDEMERVRVRVGVLLAVREALLVGVVVLLRVFGNVRAGRATNPVRAQALPPLLSPTNKLKPTASLVSQYHSRSMQCFFAQQTSFPGPIQDQIIIPYQLMPKTFK